MNDTHDPFGGAQSEPAGLSSWAPNRRRFLSVAGLAVGVAAVGGGLSACGTAQTGNQSSTSKGRSGASGETLFVAGFQWGPVSSFNPVGANIGWPCAGGQSQLIYESLLRFNLLDGALRPGLGKALTEVDANTWTVALQDGTKWSDGSDLTSADVVYTYELGKKASVSFTNLWDYVDSVTATDDRTVQIKLKSKPYNPGIVKGILANVLIMPKAIWEKFDAAKVPTQANLQPVGSGPFKLDKQDQTQVNLVRDDNYWGKTVYGTPAMKTINHPIFKTNNDGDLKLESGEIDASQQFTAQIWKMWEDKGKPVGTWLKQKPYYLPGSMPSLIFNLKAKGLENPKVRLAIAYSIDYQTIASTAMSDYSNPAQASLILPTGVESKYYDEATVKSEGWGYDKAKAVSILEDDLKAKKGSDGIYVLPDGTKLGGWKLITPTGWTDWNAACSIVAKSAQAIGIGIETEFPQAPTMIASLQNGDFDLAMYNYSAVGPATPWQRFRDALDIRTVPDIGKTAFFNYNRFSNDSVAALLDTAAAAKDDASAKTALQALDKIYRENIPVVPLMYRPSEFYEFNETNWTGFPTEANAYAPPTWSGAGIEWLFKLKKVGT